MKRIIKSYIPLIYALIDFLDPICVQLWLLILKKSHIYTEDGTNKKSSPNNKNNNNKNHMSFIYFVIGYLLFSCWLVVVFCRRFYFGKLVDLVDLGECVQFMSCSGCSKPLCKLSLYASLYMCRRIDAK